MSKSNKETPKVGVKEIARRANVSIATVDRVIHNRSDVSESTRKKIQKIIEEINYQPNILASRLASRKIYNIAVVIPKVSEETNYWQAPADGVERAAKEIQEYGIRIHKHFYDLNSKQSFEEEANKILSSPDQIHAVLLAPSFNEESLSFLAKCKKHGWPFVFINSDIPDQESLCYIGPHLRQSGVLAAHLMKNGIGENGKLLVVNVSKEIDAHHHLLRKEEGFKAYFEEHGFQNPILKIDIHQTDYDSVRLQLEQVFKEHPDIAGIFTTNSRVSAIAKILEESGRNQLMLVGYDFLEDNIRFLKDETINFLICQKPEEQAYRGIMALFQHLVMSSKVEKVHYMPIDILTKENYSFYSN